MLMDFLIPCLIDRFIFFYEEYEELYKTTRVTVVIMNKTNIVPYIIFFAVSLPHI